VTAHYQAHGKLILVGEHFVVHGTAAVALPLTAVSTRVRVTCTAGPLTVNSELEAEPQVLAEAVATGALRRFSMEPVGHTIDVDSDIPVGFGLGSSAAYCVALAGALMKLRGDTEPLDCVELNGHAHALEGLIHGEPSGIDDTVATYGCAVRFVRGEPMQRLKPRAGLSFVLGGCGFPGSTRDAVASVARFAEVERSQFAAILSEAHHLVESGLAAFLAADRSALGPVLNQAHGLLARIGVSTPEIETLVEAARQSGALGAKLTGAGFGGFVLALTPEGRERHVADALRAAGAKHVMITGVES
jgi:mevalonate kinase